MQGEGLTILLWSLSSYRQDKLHGGRLGLVGFWGALSIGIGILLVALGDSPVSTQAILVYGVGFLLAGVWRDADRNLLATVAILCALSLAVLYGIDATLAWRQSIWILIGCVLYALMQRDVATSILRYSSILVYVGVGLLIITTLFGERIGGSRSWIPLGDYVFQPVEFVKVMLVAYWASILAPEHKHKTSLIRAGFVTLLGVFFLVLQRDMGPVLVAGLVALLWARYIKVPFKWLAAATTLVALVASVTVLRLPHISERIQAWAAPWSDPFGSGYQTLQARFAMGHGGVLGQGWNGASTNLPAAMTDLPLVVLIERLGAAGGLIVLLLLGYLTYRIFVIALRQTDPLLRQFGFGCGLLISAQSAVVLAGALGLSPMVGLTLPFMSYGGSSLTMSFFLVGLLRVLDHRPAVRSTHQATVRRSVQRVLTACVGAVVVFTVPLVYWTVIQGPKLAAQPMYQAQRTLVPGAVREGIVSRNGENLTLTDPLGTRVVAASSLVHVVGYVHAVYGLSGLEKTFDDFLTGRSQPTRAGQLLGGSTHRWRVHTTIDLDLQRVAEQALGQRTGAVVVLDPWTGAILAMVSSPRLPATEMDSGTMVASGAPLLNRAVQGLYPAGSVFKPVIMAAGLESGVISSATRWYDSGSTVIDGYRIRNSGGRVLGEITPLTALAYSSNVALARLATQVGSAAIHMQAAALGIGQGHHLEIPYRTGQLGRLDTPVRLAATGIGQGEILVSPLEMAVVASSVANGGYRVYPHLVTHFESVGLAVPSKIQAPSVAMRRETAQLLADGMRLAVAEGTARGLTDPKHLAGKTGTAENPHGEPHAWFVGFAPAHHPVVAFAVLVEHGGSGARVAAPIALEIIDRVTRP